MTKILLAISGLIILGIAAITILYGYYNREINAAVDIPNGVARLTIESGMSTDEIAQYLLEEGLISDTNILMVYMVLNRDKSIQAGDYTIREDSINLVQLVDMFQRGSFEHRLTFLEGWRVEEYIDYLRDRRGDEFAQAFADSDFIQEGYMFPDTYTIEDGYLPGNLASWMRNNFDARVTEDMRIQATERGLTLDQVVILASIIEREMNIRPDRRVVAGILIKRWRNDWPLQADATVQYAKGNSENWWPVVTRNDLNSIQSPFNTYTNRGLPPAPIANPGLDSILSVIEYEESPYWFYITGRDGTTYFAETLDQHNRNVNLYIR